MPETFDSPTPTSESEWLTLFRNWEKSYGAWLESDVDKTEAGACRYVATAAARATLKWCKARPDGDGWEINEKLWQTARFVHELYQALTPGTTENPHLKSKHTFWQHVNLSQFLLLASGEEKEDPVDRGVVKHLANTYIANIWMQNPYLDWVLVDSLIIGELTALFQIVMKIKYGYGYALFGKRWKAILFRLFSVPTTFIIGWIAPGVFCWWLFGKFPIASLTIAAAYYIVSIYMLLRYFTRLIAYRLRVGKTPRHERIDRLNKMELAYAELRKIRFTFRH